jgi:hypothetical protein
MISVFWVILFFAFAAFLFSARFYFLVSIDLTVVTLDGLCFTHPTFFSWPPRRVWNPPLAV